MGSLGSGEKKPPGIAALAVFSGFGRLRLAGPFRQRAGEMKEEKGKPGSHGGKS
jgi:hypothetical protein